MKTFARRGWHTTIKYSIRGQTNLKYKIRKQLVELELLVLKLMQFRIINALITGILMWFTNNRE